MFWGFEDRREAGRQLAELLDHYSDRHDVVVFALPRGGVPVAFEVAQRLHAPLDVFVVRKLGVPGQEEFAFGAIASGGIRVLNHDIVRALRITDAVIDRTAEREQRELSRREALYRGHGAMPDVRGKTVVIVDDGLATGATMRVAVKALKTRSPKEIVVAVPIGSRETCAELGKMANVVCVCAVTPEPFYGVGAWYRDFSQTSDEEVQDLLEEASRRLHSKRAA